MVTVRLSYGSLYGPESLLSARRAELRDYMHKEVILETSAIQLNPRFHYAVPTAERRLALGVTLHITHNVSQPNTQSDYKVFPKTAQQHLIKHLRPLNYIRSRSIAEGIRYRSRYKWNL